MILMEKTIFVACHRAELDGALIQVLQATKSPKGDKFCGGGGGNSTRVLEENLV